MNHDDYAPALPRFGDGHQISILLCRRPLSSGPSPGAVGGPSLAPRARLFLFGVSGFGGLSTSVKMIPIADYFGQFRRLNVAQASPALNDVSPQRSSTQSLNANSDGARLYRYLGILSHLSRQSTPD
jgi:hypothetical protein